MYSIITFTNFFTLHYISDLTNTELQIKKTYCNDVLSALDAIGSGDSIKKGTTYIKNKKIICAMLTN